MITPRLFITLSALTQILYGACILIAGHALMNTFTASIVATLGWRASAVTFLVTGGLLLLAISGRIRSRFLTAVAMLPGIVVGSIGAGTISWAIVSGRYADGTDRGSLFILNDQIRPLLWSLLLIGAATQWAFFRRE